MAEKTRVDVALVERGLCESREKAQATIMAGLVYIGERKVNKASETVKEEEELIVRGKSHPFVGRGGLKLEKAIKSFNADLTNKVCMDIGCATGGFTDVCLRSGAKHVYAIDVGYGQFDWGLRNDERVTLMERTNARALTPDMVPLHPTVTVMDVSFISIKLIIPVAASLMGEEGVFYTLIKPQFEVGKGKVGKNGIVRESHLHEEVLRSIRDFCAENSLQLQALDFSPITGQKGNIEFLGCITVKKTEDEPCTDEVIHTLVKAAHEQMKK